jgi:outer membrane lipoprotein-sorting protein
MRTKRATRPLQPNALSTAYMLRRTRGRIAAISLLLAALLGCGGAASDHADHEHDHAAAEKSLEQAVEITARMLEVYRKAKAYTDQAAYVEESVLRGEGVAHQVPYYQLSIAFKRPNFVRIDFSEALAEGDGPRQGFSIASDGTSIRALTPDIPDQMVEISAPATLTPENIFVDPAIKAKLLDRSLGDVFPQLAMLLNTSDDDAAAVFPNDSNPRLLENADLNGLDCYRVATSHPEGTRVFWIDAKTYALHRMELPTEAHRLSVDPEKLYLKLTVRIDFADITFNPEISRPSFLLAPPENARVVKAFEVPEEDPATTTAEETEETAKDAKSAKDGEEEGENADDGSAEGATDRENSDG